MKGAEAAEAEDRRQSKEKEARGHQWVNAAVEAVGRAWPPCATSVALASGSGGAATAGAGVGVSATPPAAPAGSDAAGSGSTSATGASGGGSGEGSTDGHAPAFKRRCADAGELEGTLQLQTQQRCAPAVVASLLAALQTSALEVKASIAGALER